MADFFRQVWKLLVRLPRNQQVYDDLTQFRVRDEAGEHSHQQDKPRRSQFV